MKLRPLAITIAALAVCSAVAWFLQRPAARANQDQRVGRHVLDAALVEKAAKVRITDQKKTVQLVKEDGKWLVANYYDLPADFAKLSGLINDLVGAKVQRLATSNPERLGRLEFKDTSFALLDSAGKELWTLTFGKNAEGGGRFVKFDDEKKGYLADLNAWLDADPKAWADSLLLDLKPEDVAAIEIGFPGRDPVVARREKKEEPWTAATAPKGMRVKGDRIVSMLSSFGSLRFQDTSDPADKAVADAREHLRTVKFTTFDNKTITVQLGRRPEVKSEVKAQEKTAGGGSQPELKPVTPGANASPPAESKPSKPKTETIPAGPVYVFITDSDPHAAVNALMQKRAFQIYEWPYINLPSKPDELFEPVPQPPPAEKKKAQAESSTELKTGSEKSAQADH